MQAMLLVTSAKNNCQETKLSFLFFSLFFFSFYLHFSRPNFNDIKDTIKDASLEGTVMQHFVINGMERPHVDEHQKSKQEHVCNALSIAGIKLYLTLSAVNSLNIKIH